MEVCYVQCGRRINFFKTPDLGISKHTWLSAFVRFLDKDLWTCLRWLSFPSLFSNVTPLLPSLAFTGQCGIKATLDQASGPVCVSTC